MKLRMGVRSDIHIYINMVCTLFLLLRNGWKYPSAHGRRKKHCAKSTYNKFLLDIRTHTHMHSAADTYTNAFSKPVEVTPNTHSWCFWLDRRTRRTSFDFECAYIHIYICIMCVCFLSL